MLHKGHVVYLDLHKTGSTAIARFLKSELKGSTIRWAKHQPAAEIPKATDDVWIMSVRNPVSYYVSLWRYGAESEAGVYNAFEPRLRGKLYGEDDPDRFRTWLRHVMDGTGLDRDFRGNPGHPKARQLAQAADSGLGLFTFRALVLATAGPTMPRPQTRLQGGVDVWRFWAKHGRVDHFLRLERMVEDLTLLSANPRVRLKDGAIRRFADSPNVNTSSHGKPLGYYDDECLELVHSKDAFLFETFYPEFAASL